MDDRERAFLKEMRARLGGTAAARANACAKCAEVLRARTGSLQLLMELRRLVGSYCPPVADSASAFTIATAALRSVAGRELTEEVVQKLLAAAHAFGSSSEPDGERALLQLWMQRSEVFSEPLSRLLRERWELLTSESDRNATAKVQHNHPIAESGSTPGRR
jgi:hypothetical protein